MSQSVQRHESPQSVYARNLSSHRGYPLWMPELKTQLPPEYQEHGLKIGDVGYVVPERGCFEVLFNITLPLDHDLHRDKQLPRGFQPIPLGDGDIATYLGEESTGKVIKSTSVTTIEISPEEQPSDYKFTFSSSEGALLILPHGADQHSLQRDRLFGKYARQHAAEWYRYVEEDLERTISYDSLYLITGFYKARSWALAAFGETEGPENIPAQFRVTQPEGTAIVRSYNWSTARHSENRVGPQVYNGKANQAIFISGFKIAVRDEPLGRKQIMVRAGDPSMEPCRDEFSDIIDSSGLDESGSDKSSEPAHSGHDSSTTRVLLRHIPQVSQPFHPADLINQYLLQKEPSATIAITHDDQWATLLKSGKGKLEPYDLANEQLLAEVLCDKYVVALENGTVFLRGGKDASDNLDIQGTSDLWQASGAMSADVALSFKTPPLDDNVNLNSSDEDLIIPLERPMPQTADFTHPFLPPHSFITHDPFPVSAYDNIPTASPLPSVRNGPRIPVDAMHPSSVSTFTTPMVGPAPVKNSTGTPAGANRGPPYRAVCQWTEDSGRVCGSSFPGDNFGRHFAACHGIKAMHHSTRVLCRWEGCGKRVKRESLTRHIREVHLGYRRGQKKRIYPEESDEIQAQADPDIHPKNPCPANRGKQPAGGERETAWPLSFLG